MELRALYMLGKHATSGLHPQPFSSLILKQGLAQFQRLAWSLWSWTWTSSASGIAGIDYKSVEPSLVCIAVLK